MCVSSEPKVKKLTVFHEILCKKIIFLMHQENEHKLKDVLKDLAESMKWNEKLHEAKVRQVWIEKMGTTINQYTKELRLRKDKLFISIESASLKQELSYDKEKIKEMLNEVLGSEVIRDVIVR